MYDTTQSLEKVILVAIEDGQHKVIVAKDSLDELSELVKTSGGCDVGRIIQNREKVHPKHYLGKGKIDELRDLISLNMATGIVCDDELTSVQQKNLVEMLDAKVMDRTMLILDIFAQRASTSEGKVQVELAQLKYNLAHLSGLGKQMSRLGGGIGTRGPGEKKLELDRRYIKDRLSDLNNELKEIESHRNILREKRRKTSIPVISMVGYTNAGKSTLMNALTNADVLAEDKLFATLDTTTRKVSLPGGSQVLFTDTVGFIQKLPHTLIKAFRSTLEELVYADILIHVVDCKNPLREEQMAVVYSTLKELGCYDKPIITCLNKIDLDVERPLPIDNNAIKILNISAEQKMGIDEVMESVENILNTFRKKIEILIPYSAGNMLKYIYGNCEILKEEHKEEGTYLELYASNELQERFRQFIIFS